MKQIVMKLLLTVACAACFFSIQTKNVHAAEKWMPYIIDASGEMSQEGYDIALYTWSDQDWEDYYMWQNTCCISPQTGLSEQKEAEVYASLQKLLGRTITRDLDILADADAIQGNEWSNGECAWITSRENTDDVISCMMAAYPDYFAGMNRCGIAVMVYPRSGYNEYFYVLRRNV